jgi:hypothetical protein
LSTNTPNYNLVKPDANEFYDVDVQNDNLDAIDQAIKDNSDAAVANTQAASDNEDAINALTQTAAANAQLISENADAIAGNAQAAALHEDYTAKMVSGIDLSAADVTLGSGDYYKGLLVVAAAHETHALILPGVNNHKYDIYNADSEHTLLVKKAGGTAVEVPPQKLCRVAYDGTQYRVMAGSDAIVYKKPSPIKAGDDAAGNLLSWIQENSRWEKREFGMPYDGSGIVSVGKFASEGLFSTSEIGYKLYRQADGTIGTSARSESYYLGWIESEDMAWIGMLGGVDKEYIDNMESFFAIPGASTKIRLKIDMPDSADGVMIRRSTSPYDNSGITWGDEVANITDDTSYDGDNEWYEDAGLTNGTRYYYKAFPYKGSQYNETNAENETSSKAGGLAHEYYMTNRSGSTLIDNVGGVNLTSTNISYETGEVDERAVFNGTSSYISANNIMSGTQLDGTFTITFLYTHGDDPNGNIVVFFQNRDVSIFLSSDILHFRFYIGTVYEVASQLLVNGETYLIVLDRDKSSGLEMFVENVSEDTDAYTGNASSVSNLTQFGRHPAGTSYLSFRLAQLRIWVGRKLESYEKNNLYNGGDYC